MNRRYWMAGVGALSITSIISEALAKGEPARGKIMKTILEDNGFSLGRHISGR